MKTRYFLLCGFLLYYTTLKSQVATDQDCLGAIPICELIYTTPDPAYGQGNYPFEIGPGTCQVAGEINSLWLKFTIASSGNLAFTITPVTFSDYDWALYNLTTATCTDVETNGSILSSCNSSQYEVTGMSSFGVGNWNGPGPTNAFNSLLAVNADDIYYLQINNVNSVTGGFTIDFTASTAGIDDCDSLSFAGIETHICEKFCTDFMDQSNNNATSWEWIFPGGTPSTSSEQNPADICYSTPGSYDVTLITTNSNGSDTLTLPGYITVNPTPDFPTIDQTGYTLTSSPAVYYQWQFNTVDIPGATNQSYEVTQTGYYTVLVSDSIGCKNSTTVYVSITGISFPENQLAISVSPNPFRAATTISFSLTYPEHISVKIFDLQGRLIRLLANEIIGGGAQQLTWDTNDENGNAVNEGIYFLELHTASFSKREKLVLAK